MSVLLTTTRFRAGAALIACGACIITLLLVPLARQSDGDIAVFVSLVMLWAPLSVAGGLALSRASSWLTLVVALPGYILMLVPGAWMSFIFEETGVSPLSMSMDHLLFFFGVGATHCFFSKAPSRNFFFWTFVGLSISGLAVEALQLYVPGRQAELVDLLANMLGLAAGMVTGVTSARAWRRALQTR